MDVHPTKNGINIGIDPYPYRIIERERQRDPTVKVFGSSYL